MSRHNYTRRGFLKAVGLGATALAVPGCVVGGAQAARRPNIVFILTDDQRYDAMSCAGHPWLRTPNMDRLAKEGVMFNNAFVTTSLCSPSRGSFLTGCYAHTHEVFANSGRDPNPSIPTFAQLMHKAGYETAFIGKWHMARADSPRPGFDWWVSFSGQGRYDVNKLNVNGKTVQSDIYITDELTNYAVRFLKGKHNRPFLLYLSHKAVHAPFKPAKRHENLYSDVEIKSQHNPNDNLDTKPEWGRKMDKKWKSQILGYMQALVAVDESLGRVLEALEDENILDSTVVIFAGDNGYFHGEHGGLWDKRAAYEPSIRIPLLMRYPRLVKPASRCNKMVLNIDLAPTLLELAGVSIPATVQGRSWLDVLKGQRGRKSFLYEYFAEADRRFRRPTVLAVRTKRWKYVTYPLADGLTDELYDMKNDPEELKNLIAEPGRADVAEQMKAELERLKTETGFRFGALQKGEGPKR